MDWGRLAMDDGAVPSTEDVEAFLASIQVDRANRPAAGPGPGAARQTTAGAGAAAPLGSPGAPRWAAPASPPTSSAVLQHLHRPSRFADALARVQRRVESLEQKCEEALRPRPPPALPPELTPSTSTATALLSASAASVASSEAVPQRLRFTPSSARS